MNFPFGIGPLDDRAVLACPRRTRVLHFKCLNNNGCCPLVAMVAPKPLVRCPCWPSVAHMCYFSIMYLDGHNIGNGQCRKRHQSSCLYIGRKWLVCLCIGSSSADVPVHRKWVVFLNMPKSAHVPPEHRTPPNDESICARYRPPCSGASEAKRA